MSRYQLFQQWWAKATSGPIDFRINKRSAEIGFNAALDLSEQNSDSPASPAQQLKAEIAAALDRYLYADKSCEQTSDKAFDSLIDELRQLSAV